MFLHNNPLGFLSGARDFPLEKAIKEEIGNFIFKKEVITDDKVLFEGFICNPRKFEMIKHSENVFVYDNETDPYNETGECFSVSYAEGFFLFQN